VDFSKYFSREGAKSGEIWFFLLETKKTIFSCCKFQIPGGPTPLFPASDAHVSVGRVKTPIL